MIKKITAFILLATLVLSMGFNAYAATITLNIDGKAVASDVAPVLEEGRTLVPVRVISETLGADVKWNEATKKVTINTAAYEVVFTIGSKSFTVNGAAKTLDVPAKIVDSRTVVPIRAISEAIGAEVSYDAAKHVASVNYFNKMNGTVKVTGSTTVLPIGQAAADKVNALNKGLAVSVAGGGSGAGIKDAIAGTSYIGMSSREITNDEKATLEVFEVAKDGIAIIVHPDNTVKSLTTEQAKKIFLGEIKNWKDVGGEDAPIFVQTRESGSGTRATLEEMLLNKESVVTTATPHASSALIKQGVAKNKNAIGFDSIGYVDATVKAIPLDGINANSKTVLDGTYPLGRGLYVVTKGTPSGAAAMFIDYLRSAACQKEIVVKEGYIAIR